MHACLDVTCTIKIHPNLVQSWYVLAHVDRTGGSVEIQMYPMYASQAMVTGFRLM